MLPRFLLSADGVLALLLLVPPAGPAPPTYRALAPKAQHGQPLAGAEAIVRFLQGRSIAKLGKHTRVTYEMRTNQEGHAKVPEIPQGKIRIQVYANGYQTFGQDFDV